MAWLPKKIHFVGITTILIFLAGACTNSQEATPVTQITAPPVVTTAQPANTTAIEAENQQATQPVTGLGIGFEVLTGWRQITSTNDVDRIFNVFGTLEFGGPNYNAIIQSLQTQQFDLYLIDPETGITLTVIENPGAATLQDAVEQLTTQLTEAGATVESTNLEIDSEAQAWLLDAQIDTTFISTVIASKAGTLSQVAIQGENETKVVGTKDLLINTLN